MHENVDRECWPPGWRLSRQIVSSVNTFKTRIIAGRIAHSDKLSTAMKEIGRVIDMLKGFHRVLHNIALVSFHNVMRGDILVRKVRVKSSMDNA